MASESPAAALQAASAAAAAGGPARGFGAGIAFAGVMPPLAELEAADGGSRGGGGSSRGRSRGGGGRSRRSRGGDGGGGAPLESDSGSSRGGGGAGGSTHPIASRMCPGILPEKNAGSAASDQSKPVWFSLLVSTTSQNADLTAARSGP